MTPNSLHNIKQTGFKTPDVYFESFDEILLNQLKVDAHLKGERTHGYKVPKTYFESFDQKIQQQLQSDAPKVISFPFWKKTAFVSGIAASLAIMFTVLYNTAEIATFDSLDTASIENYIYEENINTYDIASLLNEDDLVIENFIMVPISDESLESYLLNNTTIENLMFEENE